RVTENGVDGTFMAPLVGPLRVANDGPEMLNQFVDTGTKICQGLMANEATSVADKARFQNLAAATLPPILPFEKFAPIVVPLQLKLLADVPEPIDIPSTYNVAVNGLEPPRVTVKRCHSVSGFHVNDVDE